MCANKIVVQTDPENTDYKFMEGATKIVFMNHISKIIIEQLSTENATDMEFMRDAEEVLKSF